ncbi:unnamed protein product [Rotaria socialis]|uniref:F-box domain-containing protein n=1 Tax=Rotaria socialis TaxID=392032 RepID=A0A818MSX3_9BILA|nr:unnamed protein product [Rotaria socialis]CAF3594540.1 unnamed protein product [Rotaria socialis]
MKGHFELLANELIHEVFDYLSSFDLIKSFSKLNKRFSHLISQRIVKIDLSHLSKSQYENLTHIIPLNQIYFLKISNKWTINILSRILFNLMNNLQVLILYHINYNDIRNLFASKSVFLVFQQLNTLKIQSTNFNGLDGQRIFVLRKIFSQMPKLRVCQIPLMDINDFDDLTPTSTLQQLILDYCTMICLDRLLNYIPNVQSLSIRLYIDLQNFSKDLSITKVHSVKSNIRSLEISTINNIPFNHIEDLFKKSFSHLETLKFFFKTDALSQSSLDYIDSKRWECLLRSILSLQHFHFCIEIPVESEIISNSFQKNQFFSKRNWKFSSQVYTYSFNTILRIHTDPYPKRSLDIIPSKLFADNININNNNDDDDSMYSNVRNLRILIDSISTSTLNNLSTVIYKNVTSLTLISNRTFNEQVFLTYLFSIINRDKIIYLNIQLDNCSKNFLLNFIQNLKNLSSLTISTYQSWPKLIQLTSYISKSNIRLLTVYEVLMDFNQFELLHQLFNQLETVSVNITAIEDCYRLLTLLFIGNKRRQVERLRSLAIKCDFHEPDAIANWVRSNVLRKLSYKCTTSALMIWL